MYSTAFARQAVADVSKHLDEQQRRRSRLARLRAHRA
jgi:hypothetical protein